VNVTSGQTTLIRSNVGNGVDAINAIGYNVLDNYLYGAIFYGSNQTSSLLRIAANGDTSVVAPLVITGGGAPTAGDVDENGQYWATVGGRFFVQVDLKPGSPTYGQTRSSGLSSLLSTVPDWAYVPGGGDALWGFAYQLIGILGTTALMRFDRTTKTWSLSTNFNYVTGSNTWGAVYAGNDGFLYGSENTSGEIWRFPIPGTGTNVTTPLKVANGPASGNNDGARCIKAKPIS
jgi:hypothetical protein